MSYMKCYTYKKKIKIEGKKLDINLPKMWNGARGLVDEILKFIAFQVLTSVLLSVRSEHV